MPKSTRTNPKPGDVIAYMESGERKFVEIVSVDERGIVTYREEGVERMTSLTVWRLLAAKNWRAPR